MVTTGPGKNKTSLCVPLQVNNLKFLLVVDTAIKLSPAATQTASSPSGKFTDHSLFPEPHPGHSTVNHDISMKDNNIMIGY